MSTKDEPGEGIIIKSKPPALWFSVFASLLLSLSCSITAFAADFGEVQLQSGLGEPFKAIILIGGVSQNAMVPSCFKAKIETASGELLTNPRLEFDRFDGNRNTVQVRLSSFVQIAEPAIKLTLELICDGAVLRVYPLLLDFPEIRNQVRPRAASIDGSTQALKYSNATFRSDRALSARAVQISTEMNRSQVDTNGLQTTKNLDYQLTSYTSEAAPDQSQAKPATTLLVPFLVVVILVLIAAILTVIFLIKNMQRAGHTALPMDNPETTDQKQRSPVRPAPAPATLEPSTEALWERHVKPNTDESVNPPVSAPIAPLPTNAFNLFANREGQSIEIEEISDAMQEAQFWLSINKPARAIEILEPQCVDDNPPTPVMWLLLLDVYRTAQDQESFARLRQRFKQKFNTHILGMNELAQPHSVKFLCDFEHLTGKLAAFWNTNYILPFLESLLIDDREGERVGFELSVYQDILMLIAIAKELDKERAKGHQQQSRAGEV